MNTASSLMAVSSPQIVAPQAGNGKSAQDVHDAFTQFVGQTFYGHMMKAMRSTQDKPAYFHGGQAEEVFQGQLDQAMVEHMSEASADQFAEPLFARQFPRQAAELRRQEASVNSTGNSTGLKQLEQLRRR